MLSFTEYKQQYSRYLNLVVKYLQTYLLITYLGNYDILHDKNGRKNPKYHQATKFLDYMFYDAYKDRTMENLLSREGTAVREDVPDEYPYYHFYDPTHLDQIFLSETLIKNTWLRFRQFIDHDYFRVIETCMSEYKSPETCYMEILGLLCSSINLPMQDESKPPEGDGLDVANEYSEEIPPNGNK